MLFLRELAATLRPWSDLYNANTALSDGVTFAHIAGVMLAGGFAMASDRLVLRAGRAPAAERHMVLRELRDVHRPVIWGLAIVVLSGIAMLLSDVRTFLPSWVFWTKMALIALLLANGTLLQRAERGLAVDPLEPRTWLRLRRASVRSMGLWVVIVLLGVILTSVG